MTVVKVIELVGSSDKGWQEAAENAVAEAEKTLSGLIGVEVISWTASLDEKGKIKAYKANVKVAFKVKGSD
jgi:flavin-binding protein dodecin